MKKKDLQKQKGAVIVLFALMLPVFIGGVGLAIDAGAMYEQNRRMQTAADAAALAAAQEVRELDTASYETAALDGAEADPAPFRRCVYMFDGNDEQALARARDLWRRWRERGLALTYWQQTERGWQKAMATE